MTRLVVLEKVYGFPLQIFIGEYESYAQWCFHRYGIREEQEYYGGESFLICRDSGEPWDGVIWLPQFSSGNPGDVAALAHECLHIALRIAGKTGLPVNEYCSEPLVYLFEFYFRESLQKLLKLERTTRQV